MPSLRELLQRFRPTGAPGAAARTGVPADRPTELAAELAGVLDSLDPVQEECRTIRDRARRDADRTVREAHERAAALVAEARSHADAERAAAAEHATGDVAAERRRIADEADRTAALIRNRAGARTPALVARAVTLVENAGREP